MAVPKFGRGARYGLRTLASPPTRGRVPAHINSYVFQRGDLTAIDSFGIQSFVDGVSGGSSTIDSEGTFWSKQTTLLADVLDGPGSVTVTHTGDLTSLLANAVNAYAYDGDVKVTVNGNSEAKQTALQAIASVGVGRNVEVYSYGTVRSFDENGILAQTLGTGGVDDAGTAYVTSEGDIWASINGIHAAADDNVTVNQTGGIWATNERGIFAHSFYGNTSVMVDGYVGTVGSGGNADAIFAAAENGTAAVTLLSGSVATGGTNPTDSFGVQFGDGGTDTLNNYGWVNDAHGGQSVGGGTGSETINNYNRISGSFFLGGGTDVFNNMEGAWTDFGGLAFLGTGENFNNDGSVAPLGIGTVGTTVLTGDFIQSSTGRFYADVDFNSGPSDLLSVPNAGDAVVVDGLVLANLTNIGTSTSPKTVTIIDNTGGVGVTDNGIATTDQGPLQVSVSTTANTVDITVAVDLAFAALEGNQATLGDFFQNEFDTLVPGGLDQDQEDFFLALINSGDGYAGALDTLSPEYANAAIKSAFAAAQGFGNNFFSCSVRDGDYRFLAQNTCAWGIAGGRFYDRDAGSGSLGVKDRAADVAAGVQVHARRLELRLRRRLRARLDQLRLDRPRPRSAECRRRRQVPHERTGARRRGGRRRRHDQLQPLHPAARGDGGGQPRLLLRGWHRARDLPERDGQLLPEADGRGRGDLRFGRCLHRDGRRHRQHVVREYRRFCRARPAMLEIGTEFGSGAMSWCGPMSAAG